MDPRSFTQSPGGLLQGSIQKCIHPRLQADVHSQKGIHFLRFHASKSRWASQAMVRFHHLRCAMLDSRRGVCLINWFRLGFRLASVQTARAKWQISNGPFSRGPKRRRAYFWEGTLFVWCSRTFCNNSLPPKPFLAPPT